MRIDKIKNNSLSFNAVHSENKNISDESVINNRSKLALSLAALATIGLSIVGVKKTAKMTFEEALKKNGVEIKNGIATLIENGEKFTGKIQRFETRNRKETVEFADGLIKEKVYHNVFGREFALIHILQRMGKKHLLITIMVGNSKIVKQCLHRQKILFLIGQESEL